LRFVMAKIWHKLFERVLTDCAFWS
jgi:hypothetical protein